MGLKGVVRHQVRVVELNENEQPETEEEPVVPVGPFVPLVRQQPEEIFLPNVEVVLFDTLVKSKAKALTECDFSIGPLILALSDSIELHFYDNGRVDNDTVSVFLTAIQLHFCCD